jgi:hypothetical protein
MKSAEDVMMDLSAVASAYMEAIGLIKETVSDFFCSPTHPIEDDDGNKIIHKKELILKTIFDRNEIDKRTVEFRYLGKNMVVAGFWENGIFGTDKHGAPYKIQYSELNPCTLNSMLKILSDINSKCKYLLKENERLEIRTLEELEEKVFNLFVPHIEKHVLGLDSEYHLSFDNTEGFKSKNIECQVGLDAFVDALYISLNDCGSGQPPRAIIHNGKTSIEVDSFGFWYEGEYEKCLDVDKINPICHSKILKLFENFINYVNEFDKNFFTHERVDPIQYSEDHNYQRTNENNQGPGVS